MSKIVRGFWDCEYCNGKHIDGLVDKCPHCGKQKSSNVKYYMDTKHIEYLSATDLEKAGIRAEDCDGNHSDWICDYCGQLNNYRDLTCVACASPKGSAKSDYFTDSKPLQSNFNGTKLKSNLSEWVCDYCSNTNYESSKTCKVCGAPRFKLNTINDTIIKSTNSVSLTERLTENSKSSYESLYGTKVEQTQTIEQANFMTKLKSFWLNYNSAVLVLGGILLVIFLLLFGFWPRKTVSVVTDTNWERVVYIEDLRTVLEDDWSVPSGGRLRYTRQEIHHYTKVLDYYETVTKTREVTDGYDVSYIDNGNGTFTEVSSPRYRTETYTEQEPVYKDEPVYETKYYYDIDKWFVNRSYKSNGTTHEVYWNLLYDLAPNERDTKRSERYWVIYDDIKNSKDETKDDYKKEYSYNDWKDINVDDKIVVTHNIFGMVYKTESYSK